MPIASALVDDLAAAVVAPAGIALGVLVRQRAAERGEHRGAGEVLAGDQLQAARAGGPARRGRRRRCRESKSGQRASKSGPRAGGVLIAARAASRRVQSRCGRRRRARAAGSSPATRRGQPGASRARYGIRQSRRRGRRDRRSMCRSPRLVVAAASESRGHVGGHDAATLAGAAQPSSGAVLNRVISGATSRSVVHRDGADLGTKSPGGAGAARPSVDEVRAGACERLRGGRGPSRATAACGRASCSTASCALVVRGGSAGAVGAGHRQRPGAAQQVAGDRRRPGIRTATVPSASPRSQARDGACSQDQGQPARPERLRQPVGDRRQVGRRARRGSTPRAMSTGTGIVAAAVLGGQQPGRRPTA